MVLFFFLSFQLHQPEGKTYSHFTVSREVNQIAWSVSGDAWKPKWAVSGQDARPAFGLILVLPGCLFHRKNDAHRWLCDTHTISYIRPSFTEKGVKCVCVCHVCMCVYVLCVSVVVYMSGACVEVTLFERRDLLCFSFS